MASEAHCVKYAAFISEYDGTWENWSLLGGLLGFEIYPWRWVKALVSSLYFSLAMCGKFAFLNTLTLMCYNVMCPQLQVCPEVDRSHPNCEPNSFFFLCRLLILGIFHSNRNLVNTDGYWNYSSWSWLLNEWIWGSNEEKKLGLGLEDLQQLILFGTETKIGTIQRVIPVLDDRSRCILEDHTSPWEPKARIKLC